MIFALPKMLPLNPSHGHPIIRILITFNGNDAQRVDRKGGKRYMANWEGSEWTITTQEYDLKLKVKNDLKYAKTI